MISRLILFVLLFTGNCLNAQINSIKRQKHDANMSYAFHGVQENVYRKTVPLKKFREVVAYSYQFRITRTDTVYSVDGKNVSKKRYQKACKRYLKNDNFNISVDTLVYVIPGATIRDTLIWSSYRVNVYHKINYRGKGLTRKIIQDWSVTQKYQSSKEYKYVQRHLQYPDTLFGKSFYATSQPLPLSNDIWKSTIFGIKSSKVSELPTGRLKAANFCKIEDIRTQGCNLFYLHRDVPYKMLVRLNQKMTFEHLLEPLTECDSFLKSKENYDLYFLCLKDYNRGLLNIDNDQKFQDFKPTDIINSEYVWIINLNGLLINRIQSINGLSHGNASASDLFSAYKSGELKFIDIERLH